MRRFCFFVVVIIVLSGGAYCQELQIHHVDVGQGDCTLIISPDNKTTVLIDAGDDGCGARSVLPYLRNLGIDHLSYVIVSHYDADHIGGMDEVLNGIGIDKVGAVYDRGSKPSPKTTQTFKLYARATDGKRSTLKLGQTIDLGGGAYLKCLSEDGAVFGGVSVPNAAKNENNLSVGLLLVYKHFRYFTGGDSGGQRSGNYVDVETPLSKAVGHVNAMKVDHHGSATSSNSRLLSTLHPSVAFIDVGTSKYHHPTQDALNRLDKTHCVVYQTEQGNGGSLSTTGSDYIANGSIKLTTDGLTSFSVLCGGASKSYGIQ